MSMSMLSSLSLSHHTSLSVSHPGSLAFFIFFVFFLLFILFTFVHSQRPRTVFVVCCIFTLVRLTFLYARSPAHLAYIIITALFPFHDRTTHFTFLHVHTHLDFSALRISLPASRIRLSV